MFKTLSFTVLGNPPRRFGQQRSAATLTTITPAARPMDSATAGGESSGPTTT